jgi:hypothetical protein
VAYRGVPADVPSDDREEGPMTLARPAVPSGPAIVHQHDLAV